MDDEAVGEAIRDLERRLQVTDGAFVRRFEDARSRHRRVLVVTSALLLVGAVLLTAGLARLSLVAWCLGALAVVVACSLEFLPRLADRVLLVGRRRA